MLHNKSYLKRGRGGKVFKAVKEHYLRDDIWCSVECCTICSHTEPILSSIPAKTKLVIKPHYIIPDTNVFMNQIDIIEHPALQNVIILQTVYEELRHLSLSVYNRLKKMINDPNRKFYVFANEHHRDTFIERIKEESPNDRNDRAIRAAVKWYATHVKQIADKGKSLEIVLLTDDAENIQRAKQDGLLAYSVREYVEGMIDTPELVDMLGNVRISDNKDKKIVYEEHLSASQITNGIKNQTLYQGTLNISMHNYLEGSIQNGDIQITILGRKNLNRAIQGDIVAVQLFPKSEWLRAPTAVIVEEEEEKNLAEELQENCKPKEQSEEADSDLFEAPQPTGKVVGIIKKNWRPYCGFINKQSVKGSSTSTLSENVSVYPIDRRIPRINIRTRQAQNLMGQRILVAIDSWHKDSIFPMGHFVKALGAAGDKLTETEVLLLEHDVPHQEFAQQVLNCLPVEGDLWVVKDEHLQGRADLRHLNVCSIDPPGCTDIDDALHVRQLPNNNYEVGVHIADVTHFVKPNTSLDEEAALRGTTVYLINKRIYMLPGLLGTNLCSLKSKVDRLAFSCIWELSPEAEIVNVTFTKSVISSKESFTYEEAQARIDDQRLQDDLTKGLRVLNDLAKKLRARRMERGALTLASPEVRYKLDFDSQDPIDVEMKELRETNALVEEFMLLANISVAEKIYKKFTASSLLRRHPPPTAFKLDNLNKAISAFGLTLHYETSKALADSLDEAVLPEDPYFNKLLRILTTRCMMQATYFCSGTFSVHEYRHYGLASEIYTHFTSPIRRYSDVIVHRMLAASIYDDEVYGSELTDKKKIEQLCDVLNHRHRMAQMAARSSVELHTNLFFKGKTEQVEGYVTRVLKNGFVVLVQKYGIEGIVYSSDNSKTKLNTTASNSTPPIIYNSHDNSLDSITGDGKKISIKLFDKVIVQVSVDEDLVGGGAGGMRQKLKLELVKPVVPGLSVSNDTSTYNNEIIEENNYNNKKDKRENTNGGRKKKMKIENM
ncbi:exosome complex exonuclease RRP44-like protein [Rhizophagus diaphanus]|nr:exosome complex exonuclease RRP44-like protein [Rhizophagus diaphanus] [Rhizophagus sp. MUCL 43196]